jgi:hypothetical protein
MVFPYALIERGDRIAFNLHLEEISRPLPTVPCCILSPMKVLLRTLLYLALIVWLGAEIFFPVVAAITFTTLRPDAHTAGSIVGQLLRILHGMGLVSGMVALALLALAPAWGIYKPRLALVPMALVILMIGLTVFSKSVIIPAMERDRMAAGGAIDTTDAGNQITAHFNTLHNRSEHVEEAILLLGLATVGLLAWAETARP